MLARRGKPGCVMLYRPAEDDSEEEAYTLAIYRESPEELDLVGLDEGGGGPVQFFRISLKP